MQVKPLLVLTIVFFWNSLKGFAQQPNIVIFTADDMGMQMGALNTPGLQTPTIDRLVREGTFFTKAYAAFPSCSPSRTSMLTGVYPHQHGIITNVNELLPQLSVKGTATPFPLNKQFAVNKSLTTMVEMLKEAGYFTGLTGKLHVSSPEKFPYDYWNKNTDANAFIRKVKEIKKPFFLNFNVHTPHRPYAKSPNNRKNIPLNLIKVPPYLPANNLMRQDWSDYLGAIEAVDQSLADLLALLKKEGLKENTLIVFLSDHGPSIHRGKYYEYPFGSHVPVIFSGLKVPKNKITPALFSLTDLMPTILDLVQMPIPTSVAGKSAKAVIEKGQTSSIRYAYTEVAFPRKGESNYQGRGMTDGRYWYIRRNGKSRMPGKPEDNYDAKLWGNFSYEATLIGEKEFPQAFALMQVSENIPPAEELFDLSNDPWTMKDLSKDDAHQTILKRMRKQMDEWIKSTDDKEMMVTLKNH